MRAIAAVLLALATIGNAQAQPAPVFGQGVMAANCGRLSADIPKDANVSRHPMAFAMLSWTEGYITALNIALGGRGEDAFDMSSLTAREMWDSLYSYCSRNPDEVAVSAVIDVTEKLTRRPFD